MSSPQPLLRLSDLRFRWRRDAAWTIDLPEFALMPGERVFLGGPSGSGKSTLLGLIAGVLHANTGHIELLGTDLSGLGAAARDRFRADHIGLVFQLFNLIPYLSVLDNVTLPCRFSPRRQQRIVEAGSRPEAEALRLLEHLNLADPTLLAKPVTELSVGQQQRVAAARALIGSPELLIADEPTSALDTEHRRGFLDLLFRECEAQGSTLLFVSHDRSLAERFDRRLELGELNHAQCTATESPA